MSVVKSCAEEYWRNSAQPVTGSTTRLTLMPDGTLFKGERMVESFAGEEYCEIAWCEGTYQVRLEEVDGGVEAGTLISNARLFPSSSLGMAALPLAPLLGTERRWQMSVDSPRGPREQMYQLARDGGVRSVRDVHRAGWKGRGGSSLSETTTSRVGRRRLLLASLGHPSGHPLVSFLVRTGLLQPAQRRGSLLPVASA